METGAKSWTRGLVLALDGVLVAAAMVLARLAHGVLRDTVPGLKDLVPFESYALLAFLVLPLWLALLRLHELDRLVERPLSAGRMVVRLVQVHLWGFLGLASMLFLAQVPLNRSLVALFFACSFAVLLGARLLLRAWLRSHRARGLGRERLLLVGDPSEPLRAFYASTRVAPDGAEVVGYLGPPTGDPSRFPRHRGGVDLLDEVLHAEAVDRVLFFPPYDVPERVRDRLGPCQALGIPVAFHVAFGAEEMPPPHILGLEGRPFVSYAWTARAPELLGVKHAVDVLAAALGLLLLSPLLLLIALGILVTMGRPVLFVQERIGLHGRRFPMFKFRTMVEGAEERRDALLDRNEMTGPVFKIRDDPRVTRLGALLRRTSLDELPQLWNVVRGEMSLVGPRPLPLEEQDRIQGARRRRLSMRPGITGLWQVSGRNDLDFDQWMRLDLRYVDEWSPWLDLRILVSTLPAVLSGRGAH